MSPQSSNPRLDVNAKSFKAISLRARNLLALEENLDVDFKKSLAGLDSEDLVAFANSKHGGAILIGVAEEKLSHGRRRGRVVGCDVGDKERVGIVSRAHGCFPPIDIEVFIENLQSKRPFLRIEVAPGRDKPYCSSGGTYKIRGDGRNLPLVPSQLLQMFLENQSRDFVERFRQATTILDQKLVHLIRQANSLDNTLLGLEDGVSDAQSNSEEALTNTQVAEESLDELLGSTRAMHEKLDALLEKFEIENPETERIRAEIAAWEAIGKAHAKRNKSKKGSGKK